METHFLVVVQMSTTFTIGTNPCHLRIQFSQDFPKLLKYTATKSFACREPIKASVLTHQSLFHIPTYRLLIKIFQVFILCWGFNYDTYAEFRRRGKSKVFSRCNHLWAKWLSQITPVGSVLSMPRVFSVYCRFWVFGEVKGGLQAKVRCPCFLDREG